MAHKLLDTIVHDGLEGSIVNTTSHLFSTFEQLLAGSAPPVLCVSTLFVAAKALKDIVDQMVEINNATVSDGKPSGSVGNQWYIDIVKKALLDKAFNQQLGFETVLASAKLEAMRENSSVQSIIVEGRSYCEKLTQLFHDIGTKIKEEKKAQLMTKISTLSHIVGGVGDNKNWQEGCKAKNFKGVQEHASKELLALVVAPALKKNVEQLEQDFLIANCGKFLFAPPWKSADIDVIQDNFHIYFH